MATIKLARMQRNSKGIKVDGGFHIGSYGSSHIAPFETHLRRCKCGKEDDKI